MKTVNIALASDENYFPGLLGTIASILISASPFYLYRIYVLDGGITDESTANLRLTLSKIKVKYEIQFLKPDLRVFEGLPKLFFKSALPYARLLLPDLINEQKVIYVDSDILFLKDISELWEMDLEGNFSAAAVDMTIKTLGNEYPDCSMFKLDPDAPFFNSGVMVIDLEAFRQYGLHRKTLELRAGYPDYFRLHDQSPLNVVLFQKNLFLTGDWNLQSQCFEYNKDFRLLTSLSVNFHFVTSAKPWFCYEENPASKLFSDLMFLLGNKLDSSAYKVSKRKHKIRSVFSPILPGYFYLRGTFKEIIGRKKAGMIDKKVAGFWKDYIKQHNFYNDHVSEIQIMLDLWREKILTAIR